MTHNTETAHESVSKEDIENIVTWLRSGGSGAVVRVMNNTAASIIERLAAPAPAAGGLEAVREASLLAAWEAFQPLAQIAFLWEKNPPREGEVDRYRAAYQRMMSAALAPSTSAAMNAARIYEYNRTRRWYRHEAACSSPEVENAQEVDVLRSTWECQAWGCVTSPADTTNVVCPACEVVIAADLPISVAEHIVKQHNDALVKSAATENIDKQLAEARKALQPFAEAIAPDADTISGWRFGIKPKHVDFVRAYRVYASLADAPETATSSAEELVERLSDFMSKYIIGIGHFDGSEMTQEWNKLVTPAIEQVKTSIIIPSMNKATVQSTMKE